MPPSIYPKLSLTKTLYVARANDFNRKIPALNVNDKSPCDPGISVLNVSRIPVAFQMGLELVKSRYIFTLLSGHVHLLGKTQESHAA